MEDQAFEEAPRSPHGPAARAAWLKEHPTCAACGGREFLEVHHIQPFHTHPELELDPANFITLCEHPSHNDHIIFGHLLEWPSWNVNVRGDAAQYLEKVENRPSPKS